MAEKAADKAYELGHYYEKTCLLYTSDAADE